jgi:hypothetical protein
MLTLYGVAVTAENARHLVATLILDGSSDARLTPPKRSPTPSRGVHTLWR